MYFDHIYQPSKWHYVYWVTYINGCPRRGKEADTETQSIIEVYGRGQKEFYLNVTGKEFDKQATTMVEQVNLKKLNILPDKKNFQDTGAYKISTLHGQQPDRPILRSKQSRTKKQSAQNAVNYQKEIINCHRPL